MKVFFGELLRSSWVLTKQIVQWDDNKHLPPGQRRHSAKPLAFEYSPAGHSCDTNLFKATLAPQRVK
eukprot:1751094-Amphidinium_carterae.1